MREIGIDRPGLSDPEFLHDHETQTVHEAVGLVVVPPEVLKGSSFVFLIRAVDARKAAAEEALARMHSVPVTRPRVRPALALAVADQSDRFRDHLRRCHKEIGETSAALALEDCTNALMIVVFSVEERIQEARVEEDHSPP